MTFHPCWRRDAEGIFNTVKYDIPPLLETEKLMKTNR